MFSFTSLLLASLVAQASACSSWEDRASWMKYIPGTTKLTEMTIPGTHDSGSQWGGMAAETQDLTVREQLDRGVRFVDIRLKWIFYDHELYVYHGPFPQHATLITVLVEIRDFLISNPTETVIMSVKDEGHRGNHPRWLDRIYQIIGEWDHLLWLRSYNPTLDEVRGRIVLFNRFDNVFGLKAEGWKDCVFHSYWNNVGLRVQDCYHLNWLGDRGWKWGKIEEHLGHAFSGDKSNTLYMHFTSCSGGVDPRTCTYFMHWRLGQHIAQHYRQGQYGIVVMDFPRDRELFLLYSNNFACSLEGKKREELKMVQARKEELGMTLNSFCDGAYKLQGIDFIFYYFSIFHFRLFYTGEALAHYLNAWPEYKLSQCNFFHDALVRELNKLCPSGPCFNEKGFPKFLN
jgi:1-phosphatidylinositol phosphodiesterase